MKRKYTVAGSGILILAFVIWLISVSAPAGLLVDLPQFLGKPSSKYFSLLVLGLSELILIVPLIVYLPVTGTKVRALMGNRTTAAQNLLAVALGLLLVPAMNGIDSLMQWVVKLLGGTLIDTSSMMQPDTVGQMFAGFAAIGLTAGFVEEPVFRGVMLRGVGSARGRRTAILITALVFSLIHMDLVGAPSRFAVGVVLGMIAWRTGAMLPGMITHAVYNSAIVAMMFVFSKYLPDWNGFFPGLGVDANGVVTWVLLSLPFLAASYYAYLLLDRVTPASAAWRDQPYAAADVKAVHALPWIGVGLVTLPMIVLNTVMMWLPKDIMSQITNYLK